MTTVAPIRRRGIRGAVGLGEGGAGVRAALDRASVYAKSPFTFTGMSPAFISFFCYIFVIFTFRIPIGTQTMVIALVTLPMERTKLRLPSVTLWTFAMVGWAFFGYGKTLYPDQVFLVLTEFAKVSLVMFVAVNLITSEARLRMLLAGMMLFFAAYPIRGTLLNYIFGVTTGGRVAWNGTFSNPNDLAGFCVLQMGVALAVLEVERAKWLRWMATACAFLLPLIVVLTASRGAFIALIAFLLVSLKRNWAAVKSKLWVVILLAMVIVYVGSDKIFSRLATIDDAVAGEASVAQDRGSSAQRLEIWKVARGVIAENWLTGVGIGAYGEAHYVMVQRPGFSLTALGKRDTHSTYLNIFAELGVVGFVSFLLIFLLTMNRARLARKRAGLTSPILRTQLIWLEIGLYGFLVAGIWGTYGRMVALYVHVAIVWCTAGLLDEETAALRRASEPPKRRVQGRRAPQPLVP